MPIINSPLLPVGAVVDVQVGVSRPRRELLTRHGFRVPQPIYARALVDTGSTVTGFSPHLFEQLELTPIGVLKVVTPSTTHDRPHEADQFHVSLSLVANGVSYHMRDVTAISANCWHEEEGVTALIGLDILNLCMFQYNGPMQTFSVVF